MFTKFYFATTRKLIVLFGTLFNNINIDRVKQEPGLDKEAAITLPRMSFEHTSYTYDSDRKLNTIGKTVRRDPTDVNKFRYQYNPVPYNLTFNLYIYVKNSEDGTKIIEQILPYFTPEWSATLFLIPEMNVRDDIVLTLDNVQCQDLYEGNFVDRRALIWTLSFTMKAWYYGPIKKKPIIKFVDTEFKFGNGPDDPSVSETVDNILVTPGLDEQGNPTTDPNKSIDPLLIDVIDDWDFVVQQSGIVIVEEE